MSRQQEMVFAVTFLILMVAGLVILSLVTAGILPPAATPWGVVVLAVGGVPAAIWLLSD